MYKEVVICIVVIVTIVLLDAVTQKYTRNTTSDITQIFSDLKGNMLEEDKNEIDKKVKILDEKWGQKHEIGRAHV